MKELHVSAAVTRRTSSEGRKTAKVKQGALVVTHRWTSLALGLLLVLETTAGVILLYRAEYFRATHADFYAHTDSAHPIGPQQARDLVTQAHPEFSAAWVSNDGGIIAVGDTGYTTLAVLVIRLQTTWR
jgi:hypothetical protein